MRDFLWVANLIQTFTVRERDHGRMPAAGSRRPAAHAHDLAGRGPAHPIDIAVLPPRIAGNLA